MCATRPADWWVVPDDGNRLALGLCSVCPELLRCSDGDPEPHGVIRGGIAYSADGQPLDLCSCGRPEAYVGRRDCYACRPSPNIPLPVVKFARKAPIDVDRIVELHGKGMTYRAIGLVVGMNGETVRGVLRRWRGRPQAVSTVVDA